MLININISIRIHSNVNVINNSARISLGMININF